MTDVFLEYFRKIDHVFNSGVMFRNSTEINFKPFKSLNQCKSEIRQKPSCEYQNK